MKVEVDEYHGVGPYTDVGGHGPVTLITEDPEDGYDLIVCLDCGYVTDDMRRLRIADCDRDENLVVSTWRERIRDDGYPGEP